MIGRIQEFVAQARENRAINIFIIILRMLLGFAFVPAGLKKILAQPFTDAANQGPFHEFLHAFHQTGAFYQFVGLVQLTAAMLLMTQTWPTLGAALLTPMLVAICVFCWSTKVIPTALIVSLMCLGLMLLLLWDFSKWRFLFGANDSLPTTASFDPHPCIDMRIWRACGLLILVLYFSNFFATNEVYRPKGMDWSNPSFILLQVIALMPILAFVIDYRKYRSRETARE
jgi:uncharacterized membrane protein YphA (DoxX/SURF4 family)